MKRALFPGTFDPFTLGHLDITERSLKLFDEIVIGIGVNASKKHLFSLKDRIRFIEETFQGNRKVVVKSFEILRLRKSFSRILRMLGLRAGSLISMSARRSFKSWE